MRITSDRWGPIAVIVLVATLVVIAGLGTADDGKPANSTIAATTTTTAAAAPTSTVPFDPLAENFCAKTESVRSAIIAIGAQITAPPGEGASGPVVLVTQLFETLDLSQLEVDEIPESVRDDIAALVAGRDQAVQDLKAAPPDASVVTVLSPEIIAAGNNFVEYSRDYCA